MNHQPPSDSTPWSEAQTAFARIYYNERVVHYTADSMAYAVWLGQPKGVRCCFRGTNDTRPIYPHDLVDQL